MNPDLDKIIHTIQPRWFINNKILLLNRWMHHFDANTDPLPPHDWQHLAYTKPFFSVFDIDKVRRMMSVREIKAPLHLSRKSYFMYACLKCKELRTKFIINGLQDTVYCSNGTDHEIIPIDFTGNIIEFFGVCYKMCLKCNRRLISINEYSHICQKCSQVFKPVQCAKCGRLKNKTTKKPWQVIHVFNHPCPSIKKVCFIHQSLNHPSLIQHNQRFIYVIMKSTFASQT